MVLSMERWVGKVAVVTGASSGIGAAIAEDLVQRGLIVVGIARRVHLIEERSKKLSTTKLYALQADLSREEEIVKAFKWIGENLGPVHILVNSAGVFKGGLLSDDQTEIWKQQFDINVLGLCIATREAVKMMQTNDIQGHIIHINSISGHCVPNCPKTNVYPAAKHAVTALTLTLQQELNQMQSKIKVTSISPGMVASELTVFNKSLTERRRKFFESLPHLKAEDVADCVAYALSTPAHLQVHELTVKPMGELY
ncbi:hypothetical protein MTP99_006296 [Tenebrio molitor]|nr:hypothetical protein MTP99_006296 [Tenebrio molitor]